MGAEFQGKIIEPSSRFALSADEDVRAPSISRLSGKVKNIVG
jgi:hypothetical protein